MGNAGGGGSGEMGGLMGSAEGSGTAVWRGGGVEGWVGSAGVGGAAVWGGTV